MDSERSDQVVSAYKQSKLNSSVLSRLQHLLAKFEADYHADRRLARYGLIALVGLIVVVIYLFARGSIITIS